MKLSKDWLLMEIKADHVWSVGSNLIMMTRSQQYAFYGLASCVCWESCDWISCYNAL
jgi:hypothetical protein